MGRYHLFDASGVLIQHAELGGIAVGDVAHRVGHICAQWVGLTQIFAVELLSLKVCQAMFL